MLTIKTTARSMMKALASVSGPASSSGLTSQIQISLALGFLALLLLGLYLKNLESRLGFPTLLRAGSLAVILLLLLAAAGCGSGNSNAVGTPAGTSTITITGTSGTLSHSTTITLTVS